MRKKLIIGLSCIFAFLIFCAISDLSFDKINFESEIKPEKVIYKSRSSGNLKVWTENRKLLIRKVREIDSNKSIGEIIEKGHIIEKRKNSDLILLKSANKEYKFKILNK